MQMIPIMFLAGFTVTLVIAILCAALWTVQSHQSISDVNMFTPGSSLRAQVLQARGHVAMLCHIINLEVRMIAEGKPWVDVAPAIVLMSQAHGRYAPERDPAAGQPRPLGIVTTADVFAARVPHAGRNLTTRTVINLLDVAISTDNSEQCIHFITIDIRVHHGLLSQLELVACDLGTFKAMAAQQCAPIRH
ncbi:hypothetical protein CXG81DRAFT_28303 [Caulochytrium protostelioides]|uniref:Uncharacterized protein n=1 Tax=Caulochytrium protostelioides TaxID=1555241 RepID=A0A4P9WZC3_9FUNG|nr:hypothetical protein CXG81DRAFT_28303 [Caulochytrium protostelioides]|eukprot:RKO98909.1 hypothetical protein CXG81DRAFT_28303 [Caulochytrium protostelioides]